MYSNTGNGINPIQINLIILIFWSHLEKNTAVFGTIRCPTANNRESPRIAFFLFRPLDLRSRHYATPDRLRVAVTAERKMLENPRRGFSSVYLGTFSFSK